MEELGQTIICLLVAGGAVYVLLRVVLFLSDADEERFQDKLGALKKKRDDTYERWWGSSSKDSDQHASNVRKKSNDSLQRNKEVLGDK